jgi:diguanylate cyclase (GGDEF)-like protein
MKDLITRWASELMSLAGADNTNGCDERFRRVYEIAEDMIDSAAKVTSLDVIRDDLDMNIIHKLSQEYFRVFYVDIETEEYSSYDPYNEEDTLDLEKKEKDFFLSTSDIMFDTLYEEDRDTFFREFRKDKFVEGVRKYGEYSIVYRVMDKGMPVFVSMKAAQLNDDPDHLIVGVKSIDSQVKREAALLNKLEVAQTEANTDALTGVKNKHAIIDYEAKLRHEIEENLVNDFAVAVFDVNNLKQVNDEFGHHAGDKLIRDASHIICETFKRSPVFRIGGDEFTVISTGEDFRNIDEKMAQIAAMNEKNRFEGGIVIAAGMAKYRGNEPFSAVFERADARMYDNKKYLKTAPKADADR